MKTIIFCRVSSKEQEAEGYSLPSQEKFLKEYAIKKGFEVEKVFSISESASGRSQRKLFDEMLGYVKKNDIKIIICEKVDRLTRNFKDSISINEWLDEETERQVHLVKDSLILHKESRSQEKLNWNIRILFAQNQVDNLSEEVKKGLKEKVEQGWYAGSKKRGYKTIGETKHKTWTIDDSPESEAPFIKKAFDLYANTDYSLKRLQNRMFNEGWKQKNGKPIPLSNIAFILNDPFYCGKFLWKKEIHQGNHKQIISEELFERVIKKLRSKNTPKYRTHNHLFRGMIKCAECGCSITAEIHKGHTYYHCTHFKNCSQIKHTREEDIEKQIYNIFDEITPRDTETLEAIAETLEASHAEEIAYHNQVVAGLNKRIQGLQERLDTLYIDKLDKRITAEKYDQLEAQFKKDQEDTKQELTRHESLGTNYFELGANILRLSTKVKEEYKKKYLPEKKRKLLNLVFSNLYLKGGFTTKTYEKAFEKVAIRVKTNNVQWALGKVRTAIQQSLYAQAVTI
jgi:DNA invertase Pin-like site-specific DNA recombinase